MAHEKPTPNNNDEANGNHEEPRRRLFDLDEIDSRARSPEHANLLLDAEVARVLLEHPTEVGIAALQTPEDYERYIDWARANVANAKSVLANFENNGDRFPDSPNRPESS